MNRLPLWPPFRGSPSSPGLLRTIGPFCPRLRPRLFLLPSGTKLPYNRGVPILPSAEAPCLQIEPGYCSTNSPFRDCWRQLLPFRNIPTESGKPPLTPLLALPPPRLRTSLRLPSLGLNHLRRPKNPPCRRLSTPSFAPAAASRSTRLPLPAPPARPMTIVRASACNAPGPRCG